TGSFQGATVTVNGTSYTGIHFSFKEDNFTGATIGIFFDFQDGSALDMANVLANLHVTDLKIDGVTLPSSILQNIFEVYSLEQNLFDNQGHLITDDTIQVKSGQTTKLIGFDSIVKAVGEANSGTVGGDTMSGAQCTNLDHPQFWDFGIGLNFNNTGQ